MKLKKYVAQAVDGNGCEHMITIVGEVTEGKEQISVVEPCEYRDNHGRVKDAMVMYDSKHFYRRLKYSYAICHSADMDHCSEDIGYEIALKRIKKNKLMGEMSTTLCTTLCEDQVSLILLTELLYIQEHIDEFINGTKGIK